MRWGKQVSNQGVKMTGNYHRGDGVLAPAPTMLDVERDGDGEI